jgi:POT family proton-dependent oligopeptide transporter
VGSLILVAGFWRVWGKSRREPDEIGKIAIGSFIAMAGMLILTAGAFLQGGEGQKVSAWWVLGFIVLNELGFANIAPVGLALYARVAPPAIASTIIGIYYLHLFAANNLTGWVGGFLERMPGWRFWLLHAAMAGGAGVVFLLVRPLLRASLSPRTDEAA